MHFLQSTSAQELAQRPRRGLIWLALDAFHRDTLLAAWTMR